MWTDEEHADWIEDIGGRCRGCGEPIETQTRSGDSSAQLGRNPGAPEKQSPTRDALPPEADRDVGQAIKVQALELGWTAFEIVKRYVAVRKTIFGASLRAIIPLPGIFRAIDFEAASAELTGLVEEVGAITTQISHHLDTTALPAPTRDFLLSLVEYLGAVSETIAQLSYICGRLQEKSAGIQAYPRSEYRRDVEAHDALARRYGDLGASLRDLHLRLEGQ